MVTDRVKLWDKYHKRETRQKESDLSKDEWITDSGLSFTEMVLSAGHEIKKKKGEKCKSPEHYIKKMFSTADNLCEGTEKKERTEDAAKEAIKKYIANENILYAGETYNPLDIIDNSKGNCLGKSVLFAGFAELIDYNLFSNLKLVGIPRHVFIRIKGNPDKDIETTEEYEFMEYESVGEGIEQDKEACIPHSFYTFYKENDDETIIDRILEKWPKTEEALLEKANILLSRKNIPGAEQYADKALAVKPDYPECFLVKGDIEYEKGNKLKAKEYYKKTNSSIYANRKDRLFASAEILEIEKEIGNEEEVKYYEAILLRFDGKNDEALGMLENLRLSSGEDRKYAVMGIIYRNKGEDRKAIECIEKAIEINPNEAGHYYKKGLYLEGLEEYESAKECYEKAVEINPEYIPAKKELQNYRG